MGYGVHETTANHASEQLQLGQTSLKNGDFASGTLADWTVDTYTNYGLVNLLPASLDELALEDGDHTPTTRVLSCPRQACTPSGLSDAASLRYPFFDQQTVIINEHGHRRRVNAMSQNFVVSAQDFAADGMLHLRFARAAVLQSPNHLPGELPYFFSILTNLSRNNAIVYQEFHYAGDEASLWHRDPLQPHVLFTDWQLADMRASSAQVAPGDTLALQLVAAGCSEGAHFGELLVEGFGTQVPGLSIQSFGPTVVNPNTTVDYTFEVQNHGTADAQNAVVLLPLPTNTSFVGLIAPSFATCATPDVGSTGPSSCTLPNVAPGASYTLTLAVHIPDDFDGSVTLQQPSVHSTSQAPLYAAPIIASVQATAMLADLTTSITPVAAQCCDHNLAYQVVFANQGPSEALATPVTTSFSTAPQSTSYSCVASNGASCAGGATIAGIGELNTTVDLPPQSELVCQIVAQFDASDNALVTLTSNVSATQDITDNYPSNNSASSFLSLANQTSCSGQGSPDGVSCSNNTQCTSGFCVDGVCCNSVCSGQCMACNNAFAVGICTPVLNEPPQGSRPSCGGFVCRQGACLTNCAAEGDCAANFTCQNHTCISTQHCKSSSECSPGTYCTPLGTCESPTQQRSAEPNWFVAGAGTAAQGCQQMGASPSLLLLMALAGSGALMRRIRRFRRGRRGLFVWALVTFVAGPSQLCHLRSARAADDLSVAASHFLLWAGDEDIWATQSASVPNHLHWGVMGFFNGAHNLVRVVSTQNHAADMQLVRYQETLDIGATLALARRVELSVAESFVWQQVQNAPFLSPQLAQTPHTFSAGDLRFAPKLALYRGERVRLALALAATFPTGRHNSFVGNATPTLTPKLLLDIGRRTGLRLMLNAGILLRGKRQLVANSVQNAFAYGVGVGAPLVQQKVRLEALLSAVGEVGLQAAHMLDNPLEGHLGLRLWPNRHIALDAGAGMGFTNGLGSPRWRVFVGIKTAFGGEPKTAPQPQPQPTPAPAPEPIVAPAPAPAPQPTPLAAPSEPIGQEPLVAISEVLLFDLGQDHLTDDDLELLDKVDAALTAHPEARVSVDGHTDSTGPMALNMRLSRQRSQAAFRWLVAHGIAAERLERRGFGPKMPRADNATRPGRKLNRRVEFHLLEGAPGAHTAQDPKVEVAPGKP